MLAAPPPVRSARERLRDYKWGALVEERASKYVRNEATASGWTVYRMWITAAGRALYEREWARYREIYAEVDAPDPVPAAAARQRA